MATNDKLFINYKKEPSYTLDISKVNRDTINNKKRREFHKLRFKVDLENKGIDAFGL